MKTLLLFSMLAVVIASCSSRSNNTLVGLYQDIDNAIDSSNDVVAKREARINSLKKQFANAKTSERSCNLADDIFNGYTSYNNDSAVAWALRGIKIAESIGNTAMRNSSMLNLVEQYTKSGYFNEAGRYFNQLHSSGMTKSQLIQYYNVGSDLYGNTGYASEDPDIKQEYTNKSMSMRDSMYALVSKQSTIYLNNRVQQLTNDMKLDEALKVSDQWLNNVKVGSHDYAIAAYYRSEIFRKKKNIELQKEWLARSAAADISNAVMDQASLWMLAAIIYDEGDIDRAYKYMTFSWHCVSQFSNHKRAWDVTPILSVINNSYQQKTESANCRLTAITLIATLLLIVSVCLLVYVQKKRKQLSKARNALAESNKQLCATNDKLRQVNADLHESDRVKDKYIGKFFSICSDYIEKLDNFRSKVRRKLKARQTQDVMAMTDPEDMRKVEYKELMDNFDDIFLSLYPNFVEEFNALLKPGCEIRPTGNEKLNTTLRIFALIRLGITESSRIAEILGYSPNSVYNYRTRAKNMSAVPRKEFEDRIKAVSIISENTTEDSITGPSDNR